MCRSYMLPEDIKLRQKVYELFLEADCELHFVLESIVLRNRQEVDCLENLFQMREQLPFCLKGEDLGAIL